MRVTGWPVGPLCNTCYPRRTRRPAPCSQCGTTRVLVGHAPEGGDLCGPCCGRDDLVFTCRRCDFPGDIYADGNCTRCVSHDLLTEFLSTDDGTVASQLQPVVDALALAEKPSSVILWLRHSTSAKLLADLVAQQAEITHELLDSLPQDGTTIYVRETLVATGVLSRRHEVLARLGLWTNDFVDALPSRHARIIRPFAEWQVLRDARRRVTRGRYTSEAARADREDIRVASEVLKWLDDNELDLSTFTQADLELWLTTHPTRRRGTGSFIRWAVARRLTGKLVLPTESKPFASKFLEGQDYDEQLRRCLNDESLPLEVRIVGALIRLYALPVTRIVELTTDRFQRNQDGAYFTFDQNPVLLPPKLARLIEAQIDRSTHISMLPRPESGPRFLLPGRPPSRPRGTTGLTALLKQHELPTLSARNTAMIEVVADMPPIVISDLFGVSSSTAHKWAHFAQDSWADYLAVHQSEE